MAVLIPNTDPIYTLENWRIADLRATEWRNAGQHPDEMGVLSWIAAMDPFIRAVSEAGVTSFSVSRESATLAKAGVADDFVLAAEHSCTLYNAQPAIVRAIALKPRASRNGGGNNGPPPRPTPHPPTPPPPTPPPPPVGCQSSLPSTVS